jgi:hypothetical protein
MGGEEEEGCELPDHIEGFRMPMFSSIFSRWRQIAT